MAEPVSRQDKQLLQALISIGQELAGIIDLDELLPRILQVSRRVFRFDNAIIRLLEPDGETLATAASYGYTQEASARPIRVGEGVMGRVAATGEPVLVFDVTEVADYVEGIPGACSELAVPLVSRDWVIGVFNVESTRPRAFGEHDVAPLMTLATQAAVAIENARLYASLNAVSTSYQRLSQFNSRILKSVNLGIYTVDTALFITSWNPQMEELSGAGEEEAVGRSLLELFPNLEEEGFLPRLRRVLETGRAERTRLSHRNLRGELRFQKRRIAPLREEGETVGAVVIVEDITEFKLLLEQIVQSEKLAELGRLSAGIAHEINNPLAVISYGVQLLQREEGLSEFQVEMMERIGQETERLSTLTGGLLSFSRAGEMNKRYLSLNEVLEDALRLVGYELSRNSIALEESFEELPLIQADPNKLKQVVINLVTNAVQAMGREGRLSVATRREGSWVEAVLSDTGPGIAREVQERIFEPFFTTKGEGEGTGLGLYICRTIITDHEGELLLESEPGKGTTVRIRLPVETG